MRRILFVLFLLTLTASAMGQDHKVTRKPKQPTQTETVAKHKSKSKSKSTTKRKSKQEKVQSSSEEASFEGTSEALDSVIEVEPIEETTFQPEEPVVDSLKIILDDLLANMVYVEGGTFTMGATKEQPKKEVDKDEKPAHQVTLSSYYIGKYEVTQEEWEAVMGSNPSKFKGSKRPVEQVSWDDCQEFIKKLNAMTGQTFRLPTEAEWEFAARGGNKSRGYIYAGGNDIDSVAWRSYYSRTQTHPVGQKQPNELGLYDMSGNVEEWCNDWYGKYSSKPQTNPQGDTSAYIRIIRGGDWNSDSKDCRVSTRTGFLPSGGSLGRGFRLAR